ncbi:hypothetical protein FGO68_gene6200 [Halteria grandinella]|uniref:Uncharacterized protein n=1 Tax=Halteria grandinella TaxID=5974 RepID=A0A8J8NH35_HALGN|nr:hypothetical protein FGO68_gene6200 [Halteria grandinella]
MNGKQLQACNSAANFSPTVISSKLNYPQSRPFEEDDYPFKEPEVQQQTGKNIDLKDMFSLGDSGSDRMQGTTDINLAGEHSPLNQYPNPEALHPNYTFGNINHIRSTENRKYSLGLYEVFDHKNYEFDGFNQLQGKLLSPILQGKNEQTKDFINQLDKDQQNNANLSLEGARNKDAKVADHSENCSDSMAGQLAPNENIISQQDSWEAPLSVENQTKPEEQKYLRYKNYYKSEQAAQIQRRNPNDPGEIRRRYEEENKKNFAKYSNAIKKYEQKKDFFSLNPAVYNIKTGTFDQPEFGKTPNQSLSDPLSILKHGNIYSRMDTEMALFHQASEACGSKKFAKTLFCKDSRTKSESDFLVPGQFLLPDSPRKLVPKKPISLQNEKVDQGPELFLLENGLLSIPEDRPKLYQPFQFYQHKKEILDNDDELQEIAAPLNPPSKAIQRHKTKQGHHHPFRSLLKNSSPKAKPYLMHATTLAQILHAPDENMRSSMAEVTISPQIGKIEFSQPVQQSIIQQPQLQAPKSDSSSSSDEEDDVLGRVINKQKERKYLERVQKDISLGCAITDLDQIQSQLMQMEVAPISANLIEKEDVTMIEPIIVTPNRTETPLRVSNASGVSKFSLKQASMLESIASEDSSSSQDHLSHAENIKCPEDESEDIDISISVVDPNENYQQLIAPIEERKELEPPSHIYERLQEVSSSGKSSPNLPQIPSLEITPACAEDSVMILAENKFIDQVQQQQASLEEPVVTDISPPSEYFKLSLELFSLRQKYQEECKSDSEIQVLTFEQSPVSFKEEKPEKITPNKYQLRERNAMSKEQKTLCSQISKEFTAMFGLPLPQALMDSQQFRDALTKFHNFHHPPLSKNRKLDIVAHETDTESFHIKFNFLRQQYNMLGKSTREVVEIPDDDDVQLPKKRSCREEDTPQLGRKRLLTHKDDSKLFKYSLKSNKISIPLHTGAPSKNPRQKPSLLQNGDSSCLPLLLDDEDSL